jgi:hypothetical protein
MSDWQTRMFTDKLGYNLDGIRCKNIWFQRTGAEKQELLQFYENSQ